MRQPLLLPMSGIQENEVLEQLSNFPYLILPVSDGAAILSQFCQGLHYATFFPLSLTNLCFSYLDTITGLVEQGILCRETKEH